MCRILLLVCLFLQSAVSAAEEVKIHGFVTALTSPTNFEIDDYKITRDVTLILEIEKDESGSATATFNPEDIRVGTEVEIKGEYDESPGDLKAKSIKVFLDDTKRIKRTALLEKTPSLEKTETGWSGVLFADGQRVVVNDATSMTMKPNKGERKQAKADKTELASELDFRHAELEEGEAKMWQHLSPKVKAADYMSFKPGELKMANQKYKLVPNKEAQDYITKLGEG